MPDTESAFSFVWKIENFSMLPHRFGEKLASPLFVVDAWKEVDFCLWLYPRGKTNKEDMGLFLCKEPKDLDLKVNFTLAVESSNPSERKLKKTKDHVLTSGWGFPNFMSISDIYAKPKLYLPQDTLTVRCEMSPAKETSAELVVNYKSNPSSIILNNCFSHTCIQVQRRSIMWSIRNVKGCQCIENTSILLTGALKNSPSLKLSLNFDKNASGDDIPILINQTCLSSHVERLFVKCKITVTSTQEEYETSETSYHLFKLSTSDVWCFPPLLTTSMLTDEKYLKVNDALLLRCEFAFSYKDGLHHLENNYLPFSTFEARHHRKSSSELSTCLKNIYGSGKFCDVELRAGGRTRSSRTFPYFKVVLCARSSVFRAMFENPMRERASNVVEIDDVDPDTLERMLTYMHSEDLPVDLSPENACNLYRAADKYDLATLKDRCSVLLAGKVTLLTVCDFLVFADAHLDSFLMTAVCDFISTHTTEVFHSAKWESFMKDNPKLSCYIMHKILVEKHRI